MNKTFLYLTVNFLGLVPFSSNANDPQYSAQDTSSEQLKYLTPDPLGTAHLSKLPGELKGYISRYLTDKEIGRLSQKNKQNYQGFNGSEFYTGLGKSKQTRFGQVKEFDLSQPKGREKLISYLTFAQNDPIYVSVKIKLPEMNKYSYLSNLNVLSDQPPILRSK